MSSSGGVAIFQIALRVLRLRTANKTKNFFFNEIITLENFICFWKNNMGQSVFVAKEKKDVTLFEYSKLVVAIFQMRSIGGGRGGLV